MRSKILAGTIIFGLLAVIALGIVAASPNSQATATTPTATPTPSEEAYNLLIAAIGEALPPAKDILYVRLTDLLIEKVIAPNSTQTPTQIKTGILAGLDNPTVTETLIATLKVADPQGVLANSLANFFIDFIADSTGETAAQVRARLTTPATPTPTPTPTGSATATPSPTPTPTGSPTATPSPTPTPVPPTAYLDIWSTAFTGNENMVITWDATTRVRRAPKEGTDTQYPSTDPPMTYKAAIDAKTTTINGADTSEGAKRTAYVDRAKLYFEIGDYTNAITDLTNAIGLSDATPNKHQLRNLRGIARAFKGDYAAAITDFTRVLERSAEEATSGAAANNRGVVKALQGNYDGPFGSLDDYDTALTHLNDDNDDEDITRNNKGNTLRARGKPDTTDDNMANSDLDLAIASYGSAIGTVDDVNEARIANNRGLAYMERDNRSADHDCNGDGTADDIDLDCAIADFTDAVDEESNPDPEEARFHNNRGLAFMERGDTDSCTVSDEGDVNTTGTEHKDLDCAIADFNNAYAKAGTGAGTGPDRIKFLNNRGLAHVKRDNNNTTDNCGDGNSNESDLDCAITYYSDAIGALRSNDPDIYNNRGIAYKARNNPADTVNNVKSDRDLAITDFTDAIRLRQDGDFYYNRGVAYMDRNGSGDRVRAISDFTNAIRLGKDDAVTYTNRATLYQQGNDHAKAIADFTEAIKLNPSNVSLYTGRATSYTANGDSSNAAEDHAFATKIAGGTVACSDFRDFDARHDTAFGSDRRAAKAFVADVSDDTKFTALGTGDNVCATLSDTPSRSATPTPTPP